jgi:hypothetical protein
MFSDNAALNVISATVRKRNACPSLCFCLVFLFVCFCFACLFN